MHAHFLQWFCSSIYGIIYTIVTKEFSLLFYCSELQHPNLVHLKGVMKDDTNILIVTEFLSKGNLVDYLRTRGRSLITKKDLINIAWSVYIHYNVSY